MDLEEKSYYESSDYDYIDEEWSDLWCTNEESYMATIEEIISKTKKKRRKQKKKTPPFFPFSERKKRIKERKTSLDTEWRKYIRERDNYTCCKCSKRTRKEPSHSDRCA